MMFQNQKGQTMMELIVVITVGILVVGALVFATISSLRNAYFAQNQAQATKLAQEGIERVRGMRDRDSGVTFSHSGGQTTKFSDLWGVRMYTSCDPCYFNLQPYQQDLLVGVATSADFENILQFDHFDRQIRLSDNDASYADEKVVNVIVRWSDFSGLHESKLTTILRRL